MLPIRLSSIRRALVFVTLALVLLAIPVLVYADDAIVDNDVATQGNENTLNLFAAPGATVNTSGQIVVTYNGNYHLMPGTTVTFAGRAQGTTLPTGYTISTVTVSVPTQWNTKFQTFAATSNISFVAPTTPGNYTYAVKWDAPSFTCTVTGDKPCLSGPQNTPAENVGGALTINLSVVTSGDTTPPVITPNVVCDNPGNAPWCKGTITVTWTVTDPESAIISSTGCGTTIINYDTPNAGLTLTCNATSAGGTNFKSVTVYRDGTQPTLALTFTPNSPDGNNGWWKTSGGVGFSWTCSDATSGIDPSFGGGCPNPLAGTVTAQGTTNFTRQVRDVAGNLSVLVNRDLKLDNVPPTVTCPTPAPSFILSQPNALVSAAVTDTTSGPVATSVSGAATTTAVGPSFAIPLTGNDMAGNTATTTCTYTVIYGFKGLLDPYKAPPHTFNGGQNFPINWQYVDYFGTVVNSANANPATPTIYTATCGDGSLDPVTVGTAGNSGWQYFTATNTWQYNWKTPNWAACYNVSITSQQTTQTNGPFPIQFK